MSHQPGELLATDVHPVPVTVARQADERGEDGVEEQFRHTEDDEDGEGERGHPESDVVVEPSDGAVEEGDDARSVHVLAVGQFVGEHPDQHPQHLPEDRSRHAAPAIEDSQDSGGDPGKERDDKIQSRGAAEPGADSGPGGAESRDKVEEARETGDADQGGRRDEQQWVCYHTNSVQGVYDKGPSNRANLPLMQVRIRLAAPLLFTLLVLASSRALNHMDQPLALLLIVPGYVVQAWLFEAHRALGGTGYVVTMVGVSALVWTLILLGLWAVTAKVFRS